jgi:hypothetical protein
MALDTFFAYCGVYADTEAALAEYDAVHALHTESDSSTRTTAR